VTAKFFFCFRENISIDLM